MYNAYNDIVDAYNVFIFTDYINSIYTYTANVALNAIDIYYESLYLYEAYQTDEWADLGTYLGMILSDLFLKNPFSLSWVYQNSVIIKGTQLQYKAPKYYNPVSFIKAANDWERVHKERVVALN